MNPEVKAEWVAALRSGDIKQTTEHLKDDDGMCCLGVLCDIAAKHVPEWHWCEESDTDGNGKLCYEFIAMANEYGATSTSTLPWSVKRWADLNEDNPRIPQLLDSTGEPVSLAQLNDGNKGCDVERHTFAQIADIIEKYL